MSANERLQTMIAQLKIMEAYLNDLSVREEALIRLITEGRLAAEALRGLSDNDIDAFIPIGMGIYIQSIIKSDRKFLVNVGAGISVEKSRDEALAFVENRLRELEAALTNITSQKQATQLKIEEMRREANELIVQMKQ